MTGLSPKGKDEMKTRTRKDVEAEVTAKVLEALEGGTIPWEKPWRTAGLLPTSATTGKVYRGINVWLLSMESAIAGYDSPYWLTYNQAKALGGNVRKGEKGTLVVLWKRIKVTDKDAEEEGAKKTIAMLRHYTVFNLNQTENVTLPPRFDLPEFEPVEPGDAVEAVLAGYTDGPTITHRTGISAHYTPDTDEVTLPALDQFNDEVGYSSTLLHELTHSTGHASRLNRFERNGEPQHFGSERYAREELVAEMGAAMVAALAGTDHRIEQSAAYVENWLGALKDDKSLVITAAQQAQRAVDRILGTNPEVEAEAN
jgi:antirestriction protein ArdC